MNEIFTKDVSRIVYNTIYDFIGEYTDDYINNYEQITIDRKNRITIETDIFRNIMEIVIPILKPNKIIDIGSGEGIVINNISKYCSESYAVDISLERLKYVSNNVVKIRCNCEDIPVIDEYFDCILCMDLLEHVIHPDLLINEIYRLLRPNGCLFLAVPWKQNLGVFDNEDFKMNYKQYKYRHLRSIDDFFINDNFSDFNMISNTKINVASRFMEYDPYSINFIHLLKNTRR